LTNLEILQYVFIRTDASWQFVYSFSSKFLIQYCVARNALSRFFYLWHPFRNYIHEDLNWALHINKPGKFGIVWLTDSPVLIPSPPPCLVNHPLPPPHLGYGKRYEYSDERHIYLPVSQDRRSNVTYKTTGLKSLP
jgi:hypothetical protein